MIDTCINVVDKFGSIVLHTRHMQEKKKINAVGLALVNPGILVPTLVVNT